MKCIAILTLCASSAWAATAPQAAIVHIGDASGVCVSADGLVLTCRHQQLGDPPVVHFYNRHVTARVIHESDEGDGPIVLKCPAGVYDFVPVAAQSADVGTACVAYGYGYGRDGTRQRALASAQGPIGPTGQVFCKELPAIVNWAQVTLQPGWAGAALFNPAGELIGLASACQSGPHTRWISHTAIVHAIRRARQQSPAPEPTEQHELLVFTSRACVPCLQFKRDLEGPLSRLSGEYRIRFVDIDDQPDVARQFQIERVPTFVLGDARVVGYDRTQWGLPAETAPQPTIPRPQSPAPGPADRPAPAEPTPAPSRKTGATLPPWLEWGLSAAATTAIIAASGGLAGGLALPTVLRAVGILRTTRQLTQVVQTVSRPPADVHVVHVPDQRFSQVYDGVRSDFIQRFPGSRQTLQDFHALLLQALNSPRS